MIVPDDKTGAADNEADIDGSEDESIALHNKSDEGSDALDMTRSDD